MIGRRHAGGAAVEAAVARAVDFEVTVADLARRSERRAWRVAWCAVFVALAAAAGCVAMLPLKERVPFLVMADAYTGTATVARLTGDFNHQALSTSEAINRSNVAHFVLARESYDVDMMKLRDWRAVHLMSSPEVAAGYAMAHAGNNPAAPFAQFGRGRAIRVRILSIVLIGGEGGAAPKGATVRFQRSLFDKATASARPLDSKIATLAFAYKANLKLDEQDRILNPLGFQVSSYRVDNDYADAPPAPAPSAEGGQAPVDAAVPAPVPAVAAQPVAAAPAAPTEGASP